MVTAPPVTFLPHLHSIRDKSPLCMAKPRFTLCASSAYMVCSRSVEAGRGFEATFSTTAHCIHDTWYKKQKRRLQSSAEATSFCLRTRQRSLTCSHTYVK